MSEEMNEEMSEEMREEMREKMHEEMSEERKKVRSVFELVDNRRPLKLPKSLGASGSSTPSGPNGSCDSGNSCGPVAPGGPSAPGRLSAPSAPGGLSTPSGPSAPGGFRVNLVALGDVGAALLLGLRTLGGGVISQIGIFDVNENMMARYEMEMNQIGWPFAKQELPKVVTLTEDRLFDCDMFVFCASKAIPPIGTAGDVRMMQLEANSKIVSHYGRLAKAANFQGIFAVVSDPVDPLCKAALLSSDLNPAQIRGYGLGVMNKRAEYFASKDERFSSYLKEGRAFGPHGGDLVIANSIENYDDELSMELTELTVTANLKIRELGFKPYLAPAFSSGAISLILTLMGEWHYSSVYFGDGGTGAFPGTGAFLGTGDFHGTGAFLGIKNRIDGDTVVVEDLPLPERLYERIEKAYRNLCELI